MLSNSLNHPEPCIVVPVGNCPGIWPGYMPNSCTPVGCIPIGGIIPCCMWHDSFICVTYNMYMWCDSFICVTQHTYMTWLIHVCVIPCHMWLDWFICVTCRIYLICLVNMCDISYMLTWLIHTHIHAYWLHHLLLYMIRLTRMCGVSYIAKDDATDSHVYVCEWAKSTYMI